MNTAHHLRRWTIGITLAALPIVGVVAAPTSLADDCIANPNSLDCLMDAGSRGYQPGDVVVPADGGMPQVAVAPSMPGAPLITTDGSMVLPAGPPLFGW